MVSIVFRKVMTVCETRAYNVCAETCQAMGYCRDQSSVQFYFSYLWMICLYIWTTDTYADDTTLSLSVNWNNITSLINALSNYLENIAKWCTKNKMYINTENTKALLVTGNRLQHKLRVETQAYKYALTPQISTKYCITSYLVESLIKILALKYI